MYMKLQNLIKILEVRTRKPKDTIKVKNLKNISISQLSRAIGISRKIIERL